MARSKKTITLKKQDSDIEVSLSFIHALNLLRRQVSKKQTGWIIAEDNWIFKDNEISKRKSSTGDS